uniref:Uncharacterized protein n=1 Tax=Siphoviridae sp. ct3es5 TaxID=2825322 RepID=A0A8S5PV17_9CAUD|nr:MAG TPA: hypothetical protein [Siphoviridae sp. ct3es5]
MLSNPPQDNPGPIPPPQGGGTAGVKGTKQFGRVSARRDFSKLAFSRFCAILFKMAQKGVNPCLY